MASFAAAISTGLASFLGARLLLGVGEAPTFPANAKAIGYWFPAEERSLATAIFDSAAKFASAIGVPALGCCWCGLDGDGVSQRRAFSVCSYFVLFYAFYRNPSEDKSLSAAERDFIRKVERSPKTESRAAKGAPLGYLLRQRKVWGLVLGFASYNYTFYLLLTWLPSYLSSTHHIDLLHSALYTSVPWLFATFTDILMGGWLVDKLVQRGSDSSRVRQTILIGGLRSAWECWGRLMRRSATMRAVLDQSGHWWIVRGRACGLVDSFAWLRRGRAWERLGGILNFGSQLSAITAPIATGYIAQAHALVLLGLWGSRRVSG